jgi:hypothetical protein
MNRMRLNQGHDRHLTLRRRPPPDYTQRRVKLRLFMGVAAIMLVLAVIERARDPLGWQWLWTLDRIGISVEPFNNRLASHALRAAGDPAETPVAESLVTPALSQVQDDTVIFRPAEREIWFHELARVRDENKDQLHQASLGRVSYLQLNQQPADYRGKLVTVLGTVRLAYRVPAAPNDLGVKEYCVYWVHPAGGPDSPLIVYALGTPPGFPSLASRSGGARQSRGTLREDVEVTGIFFKRCAYAAKGGTYTAPLLIANVPDWRPAVTAPTGAPFSLLQLAAMGIAALLLSICVTAVLWKRTRNSHQARAQQRVGGLMPLGHLTIGPSPEESIRELERRARSQGNG